MKLELKHLAPYLPYRLKVKFEADEYIHDVVGLNITSEGLGVISPFGDCGSCEIEICKPILRPIREVEQYFENLYGDLKHQDVTDYFDADFLASHDNIEISEIQLLEPGQIPYGTIQVLFKHNFDVFNLIEKGLAIDINTLKL